MRQPASIRTAAAVLMSLVFLLEACGAGAAGPGAPASTGSAAADQSPGASALPSARQEPPLPADIPTAGLTSKVGDVVASGVVTPEDGGSITGTDADGTTYTLFVEPFSVTTDVTIGIRPLTGSTELGAIVAGADLTPAGLRLLRPAELSIERPQIKAGWAAMDYRGDPSTARARLVMGGYPEAEFATLFVSHFSGSVAVDLGIGANQLYDKWATTRGDDTPTGRQAAAEVRYAAANMAEQTGRISPETASGIRDRATDDWIAAERDRLATDPEMLKTADGGRPEDLDLLGAELGKIIDFEARRAASGDTSSAGTLAPIVDVLVRYENAITTRILDSEELGRLADSGRVSGIGQILDLFEVISGIERQIQLLGGPEMAGLAKVIDLLARVRTALVASCKDAPVDPRLLLGLERTVQLLGVGSDVSFSDLVDCGALTNRPTPGTGIHRITGQITVDFTTWNGDYAHAVVELAILEELAIGGGYIGRLVFGPGSKGKVDWTLSEPLDGCPASGSWSGTIGTMNGEVVDDMSEQNPDTTGNAFPREPDLEISLVLPWFQLGTGRRGLTCDFPYLGIECGYGRFTGKLVHDNPYEWSFSCSAEHNGGFWSTGGRLLANW